jgi:uroporphyrinogen III methyltransferase/synthase
MRPIRDDPGGEAVSTTSQEGRARTTGIVYLVGGGPGDPGLITLRGVECLQRADVVVYDRLIGRSLLDHAPQALQIDVGKQPRRHVVPQDAINALLIEHARAGRTVVRLKGGDPFVFGRGGEEAMALTEAGIPLEVVPGVTSAVAGPAFAGIPVTHRGLACSVAIITGHRGDDYPDEPLCDWAQVATGADTLVFLMGFHNLPQIVERLVDFGRSPDTPVAVIERASYPRQRTVVATLSTIVDQSAGLRPPVVVVVGEVVRLRARLRWFDQVDRRPLFGWRVLNTSPTPRAAEISDRLWALGAESVDMPAFRIEPALDFAPLDQMLQALAQSPASRRPPWDWLVFARAEGVGEFFNHLLGLGFDVRRLGYVRLAALDAAAPATLRRHSLVADWTPAASGNDHSWPTGMGGQRVLVVDAEFVPPHVLVALGRIAASVDTVSCCQLLPADPDPSMVKQLCDRQLDAAVFADLPSLRGFAGWLEGYAITDVLRTARIVCGDAATADAARSLKLDVSAVAESNTAPDLMRALLVACGVPGSAGG